MILLRMRWGGVQFTHKSVGLLFASCHKAWKDEYVMFFFPLCLSYLGRGMWCKWQCHHNSCLLLEVVTWLCTRALFRTGFIWPNKEEEGLNNTFLEVSKCRKAGVTVQEVQAWGDLDYISTSIELTCHHFTKHLQAVKLILNTQWEAQCALGTFPGIDRRQKGQSESK